MSAVNSTEDPIERRSRTPLRLVAYLAAVGIATVGWIAFLSYCALGLLLYW